MKKGNQLIKTLVLISIYCFGIFASAKTLPNFSFQKKEENKLQKEFSYASAKTIYTHIQQLENSVSYSTEFTASKLKVSFKDYFVVLNSTNLLTNAKFKQYNNYLNTQKIRQRKSNLIFPFHNFW